MWCFSSFHEVPVMLQCRHICIFCTCATCKKCRWNLFLSNIVLADEVSRQLLYHSLKIVTPKICPILLNLNEKLQKSSTNFQVVSLFVFFILQSCAHTLLGAEQWRSMLLRSNSLLAGVDFAHYSIQTCSCFFL